MRANPAERKGPFITAKTPMTASKPPAITPGFLSLRKPTTRCGLIPRAVSSALSLVAFQSASEAPLFFPDSICTAVTKRLSIPPSCFSVSRATRTESKPRRFRQPRRQAFTNETKTIASKRTQRMATGKLVSQSRKIPAKVMRIIHRINSRKPATRFRRCRRCHTARSRESREWKLASSLMAGRVFYG